MFKMEIKVSMRSDDPNGCSFHPGISVIPPKAPDPVVVDSKKILLPWPLLIWWLMMRMKIDPALEQGMISVESSSVQNGTSGSLASSNTGEAMVTGC